MGGREVSEMNSPEAHEKFSTGEQCSQYVEPSHQSVVGNHRDDSRRDTLKE